MQKFPKSPLALIPLIVLAVAFFFAQRNSPSVPDPQPPVDPPPPPSSLSLLAPTPDWTLLEGYQRTIRRTDFERLLKEIFTTGEAWRHFIEIGEQAATIRTGTIDSGETFILRFATGDPAPPASRTWRSTVQLPAAPADRPLEDLHIAIDPGHIGGDWAKMEERWFVVGDGTPVCEGDMTLFVAQLLKPRLEALGARVSLVRRTAEPVTPLRPDSLMSAVPDNNQPQDSPQQLRRFAERLFYRTAEIRARAQVVNETLQPDLVLCLHFNAEAWGDPHQPSLIDRTHLHLLLNGAYHDEEILLEDQRFAMLLKLLQRTHEEEAMIGATVADTFAEISGLPPFTYPADSKNVRQVNEHPFLWARNLLANRLYDCPVIFMEPYVMNSVTDYLRIQEGDYEGLREVAGAPRPSIFREYAEALTEGLLRHYTAHRLKAP